jgi:hypothetical protein
MPNTWSVSVSEIIVLHCSRAARNNTSKYVIKFYICKAQVQGHYKNTIIRITYSLCFTRNSTSTVLYVHAQRQCNAKATSWGKKFKLSLAGSVCISDNKCWGVKLLVRVLGWKCNCKCMTVKPLIFVYMKVQQGVHIHQPTLQRRKKEKTYPVLRKGFFLSYFSTLFNTVLSAAPPIPLRRRML